MKSDNKRWSEEDVDELLTSFFRAEVPAQLSGPVPVAIQKQSVRPTQTTQSQDSKWKLTALVACAAALLFAVATWLPSGTTEPSVGTGNALLSPVEDDERPINVSDTDKDSGDIAVPEQDIEILD